MIFLKKEYLDLIKREKEIFLIEKEWKKKSNGDMSIEEMKEYQDVILDSLYICDKLLEYKLFNEKSKPYFDYLKYLSNEDYEKLKDFKIE